MSASAFDRDYIAAPGARPLHARPLGNLAAFGMGMSATFVLCAALIVGGRHEPAASPRPVAAEPHALPPPAVKPLAANPDDGAAKPFSAFDLSAPEFAKEKKTVSVRFAEDGPGRDDTLAYGQFVKGGPFLRLDIHQAMDEKSINADFFLDMTRHAALAGLAAAKISPPSALTTRFGAFETADIRLTQPASEGVAASDRACLATRLVNPKLAIEIAGIACGAAAKPIDRVALGCVIDRLDYVAKSDNKALDDFFLDAELARGQGCAGRDRTPNDVTASIPHRKAAPEANTPHPAQKSHRAR